MKNVEILGVPVSVGQEIYHIKRDMSNPELDCVEIATVHQISASICRDESHCRILVIFDERDGDVELLDVIHPEFICTASKPEDVGVDTAAWCGYFTSRYVAEHVLKQRREGTEFDSLIKAALEKDKKSLL